MTFCKVIQGEALLNVRWSEQWRGVRVYFIIYVIDRTITGLVRGVRELAHQEQLMVPNEPSLVIDFLCVHLNSLYPDTQFTRELEDFGGAFALEWEE